MLFFSGSGEVGNFNDRLSRTNSLPNLQGMETHPGRGGAPLEIGFHEDFIDTQYTANDIQAKHPSSRNSSSSFAPLNRKNITGPSPCPSEPSYSTTAVHPESEQFKKVPPAELGTTNMRRHQSQNIIPTGPPKPPRDPKRMSGKLI